MAACNSTLSYIGSAVWRDAGSKAHSGAYASKRTIFSTINDVGGPLSMDGLFPRLSDSAGAGNGYTFLRILNLANYRSLVPKIEKSCFCFDLLLILFWFHCSMALPCESIDSNYEGVCAYFALELVE